MSTHDDDRQRAIALVTLLLQQADYIAPMLYEHLTDLHMDTVEDRAVVTAMLDLVRPWHENVLELRALSHREDDDDRVVDQPT